MKNNEYEDCVIPDYRTMYEEEKKQAEHWKQESQRQAYEIVYLRAVKHTTEAFLGREIGDRFEKESKR